MRFLRTELRGARLVSPERHRDERGHFARVWCAREMEAQGLAPQVAQASFSHNRRKGTLRGLHWQVAPHAEAKLVRCTRGRIFDAIVDLRPDSPTFRRWQGFELAADGDLLYVPEGFAHGFLTLEDDTEVSYLISSFHVPEAARGARYDDPAFAIEWPAPVEVIAARDLRWPPYADGA